MESSTQIPASVEKSILIPSLLENLADSLRAIEKQTGQPSQLIVKVGDVKYLIGDLTKRAGNYHLEMFERYKPANWHWKVGVENPFLVCLVHIKISMS